jgi:hypothetical protein
LITAKKQGTQQQNKYRLQYKWFVG